MGTKKGNHQWDGVDRRVEKKRTGERRKYNWRDLQLGDKIRKYDRRQDERRKSLKERKKYAVFTNLKKKLLIYFLLIVFVSLSISLELIWEVGEMKLKDELKYGVVNSTPDGEVREAVSAIDYNEAFKPLRKLQIRMMIILGIVIFAIFLTLFFFVKDVAGPLDDMVKTAKEVSKGNLGKTVPVYSKDEIGQLGSIINDITADFQEVLLMVGKISISASDATDIIHNKVEVLKENTISSDIQRQLNVLYKDISELKSLVESFSFYHIDLDKL
jgi:methyl-accepting chemotaxis protein